MTTLQQHPLSAAFPSMNADDFQALKDDIENNGQREPVMIYEGMVLDGWHRYRACIDLGVKPTQFTFGDDDPVAFVKTVNLHRRHMTASQRAAAIVACSAWHPPHRGKPAAAPAASPKKSATVADLPRTDAQMAKEAGVAVRTVGDAKAAKKAGLIEVVRDGGLTAQEAAIIARGTDAKAPAAPPADDGPTADELAATERAAADELEALRKIALSDDKLAAALAESKQLRAENRVLKERNNGLMNEKNELVKRIKALQRKLDKLEQPA